MEKLHYSIFIEAPKEIVWNTIIDDETYRKWTAPFSPGSHYKGSWEEGSKILFLTPEGEGMVSRIAENRPYDFLSIEHIGIVKDGIEDTTSEEVKKFQGGLENYSLVEKDGGTEMQVEMDSHEEYKKMFEEMWPKALKVLKELAENATE